MASKLKWDSHLWWIFHVPMGHHPPMTSEVPVGQKAGAWTIGLGHSTSATDSPEVFY